MDRAWFLPLVFFTVNLNHHILSVCEHSTQFSCFFLSLASIYLFFSNSATANILSQYCHAHVLIVILLFIPVMPNVSEFSFSIFPDNCICFSVSDLDGDWVVSVNYGIGIILFVVWSHSIREQVCISIYSVWIHSNMNSSLHPGLNLPKTWAYFTQGFWTL